MSVLRPPLRGQSLWLLPEASEGERMDQWIRSLASEWKKPIFRPHLTLVGRVPIKNLGEWASGKSPIEVPCLGVAYGPSYYQNLFLEFELVKELVDLRESAAKYFETDLKGNYRPHVSLAYGLETTIKKDLAQQDRFNDCKSVKFDQICVVDLQGEPEHWAILEQHHLGS